MWRLYCACLPSLQQHLRSGGGYSPAPPGGKGTGDGGRRGAGPSSPDASSRATARARCKKTSLSLSLSRSLVIERAMPYATSGGWLLALARFARCSGVNLAPTGFECTCCRFRPNLGAAERQRFTRTLDLRLVAPSAPGGNGVDLCSSTAFWCSV